MVFSYVQDTHKTTKMSDDSLEKSRILLNTIKERQGQQQQQQTKQMKENEKERKKQ